MKVLTKIITLYKQTVKIEKAAIVLVIITNAPGTTTRKSAININVIKAHYLHTVYMIIISN